MARSASRLLQAARNASLASSTAAAAASRAAAMASSSARAAAAAAAVPAARNASRSAAAAVSRAAAMASRSTRAAAAAAARAARLGSGVVAPLKSFTIRGDASTKARDDAPRRFIECICLPDNDHLPDDARTPTDKDFESDEAVWALYERWCKAFNKKRDHADMTRRFKIFRYYARYVHHWNTDVPSDAEEAAIYLQKRREAELRLSRGEDVSEFDECHLPMELGPFSDGGDPEIYEDCKRMLEVLENDESSAVKNVTAE